MTWDDEIEDYVFSKKSITTLLVFLTVFILCTVFN